MSTPNRKKWSDLSPKRRRELSKKGITQRMHDAGLREATYDKVMYEAVEFYGADPEDVHHALATTDPAQIEASVKMRERMRRAYEAYERGESLEPFKGLGYVDTK